MLLPTFSDLCLAMVSVSIANVLATVGAFLVVPLLYSFVIWIYTNVRSSSLSRYNHSNAYALVTGASDGIGLGFVTELLSSGFNVILHGRNEDKLQGICTSLRHQFPGKGIKYYVANAAATGTESEKQMDAMLARVGDLPITMLVNNVGGVVGVEPIFDTLENRTAWQVEHILALNSLYPTQMARALLPVLKKNEPSLIMNISSLAAVTPVPFNTIYNGTKSYLNHWSHSLGLELKAAKRDIEVLLIEVGTVVTPGNPWSTKPHLFTPTSTTMAQNALQKVGCGQWKVVGYWPHSLLKNSIYWLPDWLMTTVCVKIALQMKHDQDEKARKAR